MASVTSANGSAADIGRLQGLWVLNYTPLIGNPHAADPPLLGPDFFPGAAIGCLSIQGDGGYAGFLQFNLGGSSARRDIEGACTLTWDEDYAALCGEITVEGGGVVNTLFFVMRDPDALDWMIVDTTAPSPDGDGGKYRFQLSGTMTRAQPVGDPALSTGAWTTLLNARLLRRTPGNPVTLGSDCSTEAAIVGVRFGADGSLTGGSRQNRFGRLPAAAPNAVSGHYTVQLNSTLGIHEGTLTLDWGTSPNGAVSSDTLAFVMRNTDTIDWVVTGTDRPDFSATIACGTFHRVMPVTTRP